MVNGMVGNWDRGKNSNFSVVVVCVLFCMCFVVVLSEEVRKE